MTEAERDAFVDDKLVCEHEKYAARQEKLLNATRKVLAQKDLDGLLQTVADAARKLTGARYAATGHGYVNGIFTIGGASRSEGAVPCPPGEAFNVEKGGVYLGLILEKNSIRLTDAEMRAHPAWWGLPEGHIPLCGLLGARLVDVNGQPNGMLMVSDKEAGGDFTAEDEMILSQLAAIVSLALQHIDARLEAERMASELNATISSIADGVITYSPNGEITSMNAAAQELLGVSLDDFNRMAIPERMRLMKVRTTEDAEQEPGQSPTVRALKGETVRGEVRVIENPRDGRVIWTENSAAPVYSSDGRLLGSVATFTDITERKQAEEALLESERKYRLLVETLQEGIWAIDKDGFTTYVNPSMADMLGYTVEEMQGLHLFSFMDKNWMEVAKRNLERRQEGIKEQHDFEFIRKDGSRIYTTLETSPITDAHGNYIGALAGVMDITERKNVEEKLCKSEVKYRTVADYTYDWELWLDPEGRLLYCSPSCERITGYSANKFLADPNLLRSIVYPDDLETYDQHLFEGKRKGLYEHEVEFRILRPNGSVRWIGHTCQSVFDDGGRFLGKRGSNRDITERKRAEKALRESEARFRSAVDNMVDGFAIFSAIRDDEGRIADFCYEYINESGCRLNQRNLEEQLGHTLLELLPAHKDAGLLDEYMKVVETGQPLIKESYYYEDVYGGGKRLDRGFEFRAVKLGDGFAVIWRDITKRLKAEDELEQRVKVRTAELQDAKEGLEVINEELRVEIEEKEETEKELLKARDAAEAAARTKAEFLANMSHEIRTPMNAVIGMTGLMLEEPLTPEQRDNIELIRTNGDALLTIINDILDFSKMESNKVVLEEQPFNLRQCVEESLDLVAIKASEKGLNLAYIIDKNMPDTITSDPTRLRQILGNLLSNAVKFTDEGEVILSVSPQKNNNAQEVHFAVQDTGIGIPQGSMNLLFQPFSQMEPSTTRLYGGTGLGLAISKKLVELMGGRIWAESEEGKGSTFHFTIKTSSSQSEPQLAGVQPDMIGKRVFIVSDNKTNRRVLGKQVYSWGMIPMIVASGHEALGWVRRGDDFNIAILDMDLKDMNGLELEKEIRRYNKTLPLVLLISIGQRVPPDHACLTKPIKPSQLHKVLTELLPRQSDQRLAQSHAVGQFTENNPMRILLAEDNISSQKVALQMLKRLGYKADTVANGIEALQVLECQHYDLVLMDIRMPEMDGLEATRIIRQRWPDNGPKIIAITAYALEGDQEKFIEAGMDDYIAKPVKMDELAKVLSKHQPQ